MRYVRRWTNAGKEELNILFEVPPGELGKKPASLVEEHYARNPRCAIIYGRLTKRYGKPTKTETWPEERLRHRTRTWTKVSEVMSLDCYTLDGKGDSLVSDLTIRAK